MTLTTMNDVARLAAVSSITVSRTISAPETVAAKTRQRVLDALAQVGYIPNSIAGSLAASRSQVIGVLVPTITKSISPDTVNGMTHVLTPRPLKLQIGPRG